MLHFRIYTSDVLAQMFVVTSRRALFKASLRVSVQGERGWGERYFRTLLHPTSAPDRWLEGYVNAYKVRHLPLALHIKTMWTFNYTNQINIRLHPSAPRVNGNRSRISLQAFTVSRFVHTYIADMIQRKLGTSGITRYNVPWNTPPPHSLVSTSIRLRTRWSFWFVQKPQGKICQHSEYNDKQ